ncbi:MAG: TetR/AcrR family transcriptional regulator, partial [Stellaceae bacterium]
CRPGYVKDIYMGWSGSGGGYERRGYHHGNLREALLDAALHLITEKGPAGFTIAEAARLAGVSSAAPYRHFRDAEDLLAAVALRGYQQLAEALETAWNDGRPEPIRAFEALGRAYLGFARSEPALYAAMFETRIDFAAYPPLQAAADHAFAALRGAAERLVALLPKSDRPPALMMALHVWALSHGIASLFCRGDGGRRKLPMSPEELLEAGILLYLRSLGLGGSKTRGSSSTM